MTVSMAIVDYIPVVLFLITSVILQRDLYGKMSKGAFAVFCAGTIMVVTAGIYKATWKLLYCAGVCDFQALSISMMPMQSTGFLLAAAALVAMLVAKQSSGNEPLYAVTVVAPAYYKGTMIFVMFMCSGIIVIGTVLAIIAAKMKKKAAIVLYVITIIGLLGMGAISNKDFKNPMFNWIAELINIAAQSCFLTATIILHKAGLSNFKLK